jgi:hypothetical protein
MPSIADQIETGLDDLDEKVPYRMYMTYRSGSPPIEFVTRKDFHLLPSHLKSISWLLAIRKPIQISFDSDVVASTKTISLVNKSRRIHHVSIGVGG